MPNYFITCDECHIKLAIGQDGSPLWYRDYNIMKLLSSFLVKHELHNLTYCSEHYCSEPEQCYKEL